MRFVVQGYFFFFYESTATRINPTQTNEGRQSDTF